MTQRSRLSRVLALAAVVLFALPLAAFAAPPREIPGELLVRYKHIAGPNERAAARGRVHAQRLHDFAFIDVEHVKFAGLSNAAAIARLRSDRNVVYAEPNYEYTIGATPNDPRYPELYAMHNTGQTGGTPGADIKAPRAWDVFTGDPNLKVGIIDTGIDYNHPDLAANVWTNPGEISGNGIDDDGNGYIDDVHGYDFSNGDGDPFDDNGHGSHTAGTIAAVGDNNVGVVGVNWHAKIIAIKFLNAAGSGSTDGAIRSIQYAITVGCRLTSNSWGGGGFSQALLDAINAAGAANQLFVAAAGNASQNTDVTPSYPASYDSPYIISVAATDDHDNLASFSNFGATTVDLAAPGVNILSCQPGGGYQLLSGTSMATPHVSGVVALAMGRFPNATNLFIKQLILNHVDPKPQLAGKMLTGGRLNALLSIADLDTIPPGTPSNLAVTETGSSHARIAWTAPGDDGNTGRCSSYEIRYSTSPITNLTSFLAGTPASSPDPLPAGSAESLEIGGLASSTLYYFALRARDEFGNTGPLSNVATGTTLGPPDISASPVSFSATLLSGAATTQPLTLRNVGQGTLDFTVPTPVLQFTQPAPFAYVPVAKGGVDTRSSGPVIAGHGGPDGFGYRWVDSNEVGGPAFAWVDITGTGTPLALTGDDANAGPVPIGFDFPFYGGMFNSVRICTNGWLSFTDTGTAYDNQPLPSSGSTVPANLVAPFWEDLDFGAAQYVYTYNDGTRFIVSWVGVPGYAPAGSPQGGPYTFQAMLYTTGEIRYQYLAMGAPTNGATVGIQNATKTIGLTTAFNTAYVANNLAVRIVPLTQWLTVDPTSGRILAGSSQDLQVRFNALGLDGGVFDGNVVIQSNDPDENPTSLPAELHVIGAPDIALSPGTVDFATFFVGANPARNLTVSNPGSDVLVVTSITSSDADVHPDVTAFSLPAHGARNVALTFSPASARVLSGTVTVASNDPDSPNASVNVIGQSTPAPAVSLNPGSFDVSLLTNTATTRNLRVSNGGGSNYVFTAATEILGQSGTVVVHGDADNVDVPKGGADVQTGPAPLRAGGPDVFGYTYKDSDEPGGPAFSWVDISAVGTAIPLNGDDQTLGPFPVGFGFPFYGTSQSQFKICSNGWLSFSGTTLTTFTNTSLPNTGSTVPPSLLAPFWDDLDFRPATSGASRAYYYYDGTRLIVQYKVPRISDGTHLNDFEVLLYPNGQIVYQYLSMTAATKNSATIGIQNDLRNDGLQVVFNANYVKNSLAIRFTPPARFLTVTPPGGTVPPGGFLDLTVGFNAAGLFGGQYDGSVKIAGNDPVQPQKTVPATLHVTGVPDLATSPGSIAFGNVFVGFPQLRELRVLNVGTDALVVSDIQSSDPAFGVDQTSFTVPPLGQALLLVSYSPPGPGSNSGMFSIHSNDPDTPIATAAVSGTGVVPPDIDPQPTSITESLPIPGSSTRTVTVHNLGGSDLNLVVGTNIAASSVPTYPAVDLGKGQTDPNPGMLGSGGPDVFGYKWRDSDEPGGPAFDWVDITSIGTPVTFSSGDDANTTGIPIGFDFPFYGNSFNSVNVCTNGWLSFTSTLTQYNNSALPSSGSTVPENLLAAFWDDLSPGTAAPNVYRYSDGTRFILSYVGVPRLVSGGPYTFQVILYPSGRIVYQYLDMQGTRLNEATVGIQNAAQDDGLTIAYNADYVHNGLAVEIATIPDYMTVSPTSGTIPAGGSLDLSVNFNTTGLFGGVYHGSIRLGSNDPDEGVKLVPTTLTATGTPQIAAVPASADFGTVYVGLHSDRTVQLRNVGSDVVVVSGLSLDNSDWTLVSPPSLPASLGNNGKLDLTLRWAPSGACAPCTGHLNVASNDADTNPLVVALSGIGLVPPEIGVRPASLRAALATTLGPTAISTTKQLIIENTGGSDLNWTAEALTALPTAILGPASEGPKNDAGQPGTLGNGGPDAFGYRWIDSDDPLGPAFSWVDIAGVGTPIPFTGDDQNQGPIALPFPFPFYGNTFNSVRVCTNGWLSFTSTLTTFTNTALPSGGATAPENLIAPFWDDLTFSSLGDAFYHYDGTKFVIEYVGVPRLTSGGPYTFEVLLYPNGTIDFQYLDMQGTRLNEATIGIQNATKDVGLQVAFNAAYVKNNLRVRLNRTPGWLSVSPAAGVTAAGGRDTVNVTFDATGLADGDYSGAVRIHSNDLDEPLTAVVCDLHVGVAPAAFAVDPNTLNLAANGRWVQGTITPPGGSPQAIVLSSVRVQRTVPVSPTGPVSYSGPSAVLKFDRAAIQAAVPVGLHVPVECIGRVGDVTWFAGWDTVRVQRPKVSATGPGVTAGPGGMPDHVVSSATLTLQLEDPADAPAASFDLWYSPDDGVTWSAVAQGITDRSLPWAVPDGVTQSALLDLVAFDAAGVMGDYLTNVFAILGVPTAADGRPAPDRFALRFAGRNPAPQAALEFGLPVAGDVTVRVYDVRGALVKELARGTFDAGWHRLAWDGTGRSGSPAQPGVYFVRASSPATEVMNRFVLLH